MQDRLREASSTNGYQSAGIVDHVIEETAESLSAYAAMVVAELPGRGRIRRTLDSTSGGPRRACDRQWSSAIAPSTPTT